MSAHNLQFTPYQDINEFLNLFLSNIQVILGDRFISLYLGGSLALGDFNPLWSDIDFIAVTRDELPPDTIGILEKMHHQLWATGSKWAKKLDGSYVPAPILRNWTSDDPPCPFIEEDRFCITHQGSAVIQRHIIRQSGVVVAGSDPANLINPVDSNELRHALRKNLEKWWRPLLDDPAWVRQSQKQPFAILTMCRTLYTLEYGVVASKPRAARWGQQALGEQWTDLIAWALARPQDRKVNHLALTLSLIQYTLERYQQYNGS